MRPEVHKFITFFQRNKALCRDTWKTVLQSSLSEADLTDLAVFFSTQRNEEFAGSLIKKLEESPNVLKANNVDRLCDLALSYPDKSTQLFSVWQDHMLTTLNLDLINRYLVKVASVNPLPQFFPALDRKLATTSTNGSSSALAQMLRNMITPTYRFSPAAYLAVLKSAETMSFSGKDVAKVVYSISHSTLSPVTAASYLTLLSNQVTVRLKSMANSDKALVAYAYSMFPLECSQAVLEQALVDFSITNMGVKDMLFILNALSMFPIKNDFAVFQAVERFLLDTRHVPKTSLSKTVHAFSKRKAGSRELFQFFESCFDAEIPELDKQGIAFLMYALLRSSYIRPEFRKRLQDMVPSLLLEPGITEKMRDVLTFWSSERAMRRISGIDPDSARGNFLKG